MRAMAWRQSSKTNVSLAPAGLSALHARVLMASGGDQVRLPGRAPPGTDLSNSAGDDSGQKGLNQAEKGANGGMSNLCFSLALCGTSILAGFLGAMTGLGGGVVIVPALCLLFMVDLHYALGASLISVIATSSGTAAA
jgi:hypothetical protein